jgi:hypothetical protein
MHREGIPAQSNKKGTEKVLPILTDVVVGEGAKVDADLKRGDLRYGLEDAKITGEELYVPRTERSAPSPAFLAELRRSGGYISVKISKDGTHITCTNLDGEVIKIPNTQTAVSQKIIDVKRASLARTSSVSPEKVGESDTTVRDMEVPLEEDSLNTIEEKPKRLRNVRPQPSQNGMWLRRDDEGEPLSYSEHKEVGMRERMRKAANRPPTVSEAEPVAASEQMQQSEEDPKEDDVSGGQNSQDAIVDVKQVKEQIDSTYESGKDPFWGALHAQVSPEYLEKQKEPEETPKSDAYWSAVEGQISEKFADAGSLESLKKVKVDIELEPGNTERKSGEVDINLDTLAQKPQKETQKESPHPYETLRKDVMALEQAKSDLSYGSAEFRKLIAKYDTDFAKKWEELGSSRDAATILWIERKLAELKSKSKEAAQDAPGFFDERFESLGITKKDLESIPGFARLSNGQQMLVFENLQDYRASGKENVGKKWILRSTLAAFGVKNDKLPDPNKFGMAEYGDMLRTLVQSTALYGPKVHVDKESGELKTDFVGAELGSGDIRKERKPAVDALNKAAHAFAAIPASWQEDGNGIHNENESKITRFFKESFSESRKQYRKYEKAAKDYEDAKVAFGKALSGTNMPQGEIVSTLLRVDRLVHGKRFIETNPEAVALLQNIDNESLWDKATGMALKGGIYGGIGYTTKAATVGSSALLGASLVTGAMAGVRGWNKAAGEQRERDRQTQMGTGEGDPKYQKLLSEMKEAYRNDPNRAHNERAKRDEDMLPWSKEYLSAVKKLKNYEGTGELNVIKATQIVETSEGKRDMGVTAKLERLVEAYHNPRATEEERARTYNQLKARALYAYDKLRLNRLNFGEKEEYAVNQARFLEVLGHAQLVVAAQEEKWGTESGEQKERVRSSGDERVFEKDALYETLEANLRRYLANREDSMMAGRQRRQRRVAAVEGAKAAGMVAAFGLLRYVPGVELLEEKALTGAKNAVGKIGNVPEALKGVWESFRTSTEGMMAEGGNPVEPPIIATEPERVTPADGYDERANDSIVDTKEESGGIRTEVDEPTSMEDEESLARMEPAPRPPTPEEQKQIQELFVEGGKDDARYRESTSSEEERNSPSSEGAAKESGTVRFPEGVSHRAIQEELLRNNPKDGVPSFREGSDTFNATKLDVTRANILQEVYLRGNVPLHVWDGMKHEKALNFIANSLERGAEARQGERLTELGKLFTLVDKAPYNVHPTRTDTVESYLRKAFIAITQHDLTGTNTEPVRAFLKNAKFVQGKGP